MLVYAARQTARRATDRHVLAIQDTTELHFATHRASKRGFGVGGNGTDIGLFIHPTVVVDARHGGVIGLSGAAVLNRLDGPAPDRRTRVAEDKESRRWLEQAQDAADVLDSAASVTVVADREGDIYDLFGRRPPKTHLLIRAAQNRRLLPDGHLFDQVCTWPEQRRCEIEVAAKAARPPRRALVALRYGSVTLQRPRHLARDLPEDIVVQVVDVAEIDPPAGAEPVHWCLLTTHDVATAAQAEQILAWYRCRWTIEQVFRVLKSDGVRVEDSQITTATSFVKLAVTALIAAVRVQQLVAGRNPATGQPLSDAVDAADAPALSAIGQKLEGRTEKLKNPHDPASLAWLVWIVARLGGWSGYTSKGYKPAGPKTILRGLNRLDSMIEGWRIAQPNQRSDHSADVGLP